MVKVALLEVDFVETIPLFHWNPGSLTLKVFMPECRYSCQECPWGAGATRLRALEIRDVSVDHILSKATRFKVSTISLTAGNLSLDSSSLIKEIKRKGFKVLVKTYPSEASQLAKEADAVLVDLGVDVVETAEKVKGAHAEYAIIIDKADASKAVKAVEPLSEETPIHVIPATELSNNRARRVVRSLRENGYLFVYNHVEEDGLTTICPRCGTPLLVRTRSTVVAAHLKDNSCPSCGYVLRIVGSVKVRSIRDNAYLKVGVVW